MSKQQTAIDWLWQQIFDNHVHELEDLAEFFQQAKQIECEQIAKAWNDRAVHLMGIDYYHETYGGDHD